VTIRGNEYPIEIGIKMGILITWDNPDQNILLWTIDGGWTWDESREAIAKAEVMMDSVAHPQIDSIVDMRRGRLIPDNAVSQFSRTLNKLHPKAGLIVMSGMPPFVQALLQVLTRAQKASARRIIVVKTLDDARVFLAARRQGDIPASR
jgi:hypothetical protein